MSDISDLILSLTPEDGSSIGNGAMLALLREQMPGLGEDEYIATRDELIDEGLLRRGRGRGGSIFRVTEGPEDEDGEDLDDDGDDEGDAFELPHTEEPAPRRKRAATARTAVRRPDGPVQVLSYWSAPLGLGAEVA